MSAYVSRKMRSLIETNAFCHGPDTRPGLMVNGGGCQGKTETVCEALACFEDEWLALYDQNPSAVAGTLDLHVPAAYVRTPVKATPISACQRILDFYGEPYKGMRLEDLHPHGQGRGLRPRHQGARDRRRDPAQAPPRGRPGRPGPHPGADEPARHPHPRRRRDPEVRAAARRPQGPARPASGCSRRSGTAARAATTTPPARPTCGSSSSTSTGSATAPRTAPPPGPPTSSASSSSSASCSGCDGMLSGGGMPEYLFRRTGGIVGLLKKLIQEGCRHAIETGTETDHRRAPRHPGRQPRRPARTRPRRGRGPRHPAGTRPACPEAAQAAEHRLRRPGRPRRRDRGLTGDARSPGRCPGAWSRSPASRCPGSSCGSPSG